MSIRKLQRISNNAKYHNKNDILFYFSLFLIFENFDLVFPLKFSNPSASFIVSTASISNVLPISFNKFLYSLSYTLINSLFKNCNFELISSPLMFLSFSITSLFVAKF